MSKLKVRPLHDRVIVEPVERKAVTNGGVHLPDSATEKPLEGKVMAIGGGKVFDNGTVVKLDVEVGDTVLYGRYAGSEITVDGEKYLIMREDDIMGVVEL